MSSARGMGLGARGDEFYEALMAALLAASSQAHAPPQRLAAPPSLEEPPSACVPVYMDLLLYN